MTNEEHSQLYKILHILKEATERSAAAQRHLRLIEDSDNTAHAAFIVGISYNNLGQSIHALEDLVIKPFSQLLIDADSDNKVKK